MRCSACIPPPLFPRTTVLSAQHLSPELAEKSRASSRRLDPPRCLLWDYGAEGVGIRRGLSRGRLRRQLRERGSHGKGPPKAWNASEVSRGWSRGGPEELSRDGAGAFVQAVRHQRRDGAEKVSAGAVKQVPLFFLFCFVLVFFLARWLSKWVQGRRWCLAPMLWCYRGHFLYLNELQSKKATELILRVTSVAPSWCLISQTLEKHFLITKLKKDTGSYRIQVRREK